MEEFEFSTKFAWKMRFLENWGSFELNLNLWVVIISVIGIKKKKIIFKTWYSLILASLTPSQTDKIENGWKLIPELIS